MTTETLNLTLGLALTPRTKALFDRSVQPEGINLECREQFSEGYDNTGARHRWIIEGRISGGELSTSSFILARSQGVPIRALPVFLGRKFRHRCIYCPLTSHLKNPSELKGRRVTVHRYNSTTAVWVRGLLENEYGVRPEEMEWHLVESEIGEEALSPAPRTVRVQFIPAPRTREHAIQMVGAGEIDVALEPYTDLAKNPNLRCVLEEPRQTEAEYFLQTGVLPVIHTLVLREDIVADHPWVVKNILIAFRRARALDERYLSEEDKNEARWLRDLVGDDPFSYLLDSCAKKTLETLIDYQVQQGLLKQRPVLNDLFFPQSLQD
ncbi:MAG: ABC transporter substrate-binding protein [Deltaproteobacteria bacterium]|nr:ABC transporter substrate-binding protein [Deltaproteobacteria bacterium]